jgi:holo-[acyl-carrier protein] synthase
MIVGIGVDLVDIMRFEHGLKRTPALLTRLFAESERVRGDRPMPLRSLAGRFAAKEALIKALGDSAGVTWHDMRVVPDVLGNPGFVLGAATQAIVDSKGITAIHLSMSHDAGMAIAYVIAEAVP